MIRPFSPDDALAAKSEVIPPFIIEAVNQLLAKRFSGSSCTIKQDELIDLAEKIGIENGTIPGWANRQTFFDEHWLDFEPIYKKAGWSVVYDKPGWDESYTPFWRFERPR